MIQRVQSVFLALAMLLTSLLFSFVLCDFHLPSGEIAVMKMSGFTEITNSTGDNTVKDVALIRFLNDQVVNGSRFPLLLLLTSVQFILLTVTLFSYRNRPRQLKLCTATFFLNILLLGLLFLGPDMLSVNLSNALDLGLDKQTARKMVHYQWGSFFPFGSLIFINLASRFIKKDENLIRSADRLR